jgi:hypothetical protein
MPVDDNGLSTRFWLCRSVQVCEGDGAAQAVRAWLATGYAGSLNIEVRMK